jgi:hypothetical protein
VVQRGRGLVRNILARGMDSGEFRRVDPDYAWRVVIAPLVLACSGNTPSWLSSRMGWISSATCKAHLDLLFNGLAAEHDTAKDVT